MAKLYADCEWSPKNCSDLIRLVRIVRQHPLLPFASSSECSQPFSRSAANVLVGEHREDAALEAAQRADAMLERGDMEGCAVWKRIVAAIEEIERTERWENEAAH